MVRKHFFLSNHQIRSLRQIVRDGKSEGEHIRLALDEYIDRKMREKINVSASASKGGVIHDDANVSGPPEND